MEKKLGADRYMTKPFDPDKLVEVVSKVLGTELKEPLILT